MEWDEYQLILLIVRTVQFPETGDILMNLTHFLGNFVMHLVNIIVGAWISDTKIALHYEFLVESILFSLQDD